MSKSKKPITHVLLVTDMSGSMSHLAADVRGGFNSYIDLLQGTGRYRVTATLFNTAVTTLCTDVKLRDVPHLDAGNYRPGGGTALLDAVGQTITDFDARVPELADGERVIVVVQTDGEENSSKEHTREAAGTWSFTYIGAGADTWDQAQRMGFNRDSYVNTGDSAAATSATYSGLIRGTQSFAAGESGDAIAKSIAAEPGAVKQS